MGMQAINDGVPLNVAIRQLETEYICAALNKTNGNKAEAARLAGMTYPTFVRKLSGIKFRVTFDVD